jgi:hypothetical protein
MAASISPSVIMTQVHDYMNSHNISTDALFQPETVANTIFSYKWLIGTMIFALVASVRLFHYFFIHDQPPRGSGLKLMPGPRSTIPWLGRVHDVDPNCPWFAMRKFSDEFNGVFRTTICGEMHVWVGDAQVAYDLLCKKASIYSSRPQVPAVPGSDSQGQYLPLLAHDGMVNRKKSTKTCANRNQTTGATSASSLTPS